MDLELREALALSEDRKSALAQLLPGSQNHDYWRCVYAQHAGDLDEAQKIIDQWPERHGANEQYTCLQLRQLLYRSQRDLGPVADNVRDWFGANHWHEREVEEIDPTRPTRLADDAFDANSLLQQAIDHDTNLSQVTNDGLYELLERPLDAARRRVLLTRIQHTPQRELVSIVADDLGTKNSTQFGSVSVHEQLTLDQLHALAQLKPELKAHLGWVSAAVRRMAPTTGVDLDVDRDARHAYLERLWTFVGPLPGAINSLKVHVLWHLLDTTRRRGLVPDPKLFATYLQLPRHASYLSRKWMERFDRHDVAQMGSDFRGTTGLPPTPNDEELVRDLLHQRIDQAEQYALSLDREWLDAEIATAKLLYSDRDTERATVTLGPARAAALRERIDLTWCVQNPTRFGIDEPIVLEADVKHVPELVVKVFRVDPLAYFQNTKREVGTDLDLDGLAASHEQTLHFTEPAIRRVRRRIELPTCARPGTYVIDLIGNGMSSRAVVHKGRLRHTSRLGAAGHVVTIVDDAGRSRPDARAFIGEREYVPDEKGAFVIPFSTAPASTPMLLASGDVANVQQIELQRETPSLFATVLLDREGLTAGRTARAVVRARLTIAGAPASLALIKRPTWDVTLTDRHGVSTTKSQPLELDDIEATVLEWALDDDTANIHIAIRGAVEIRSEQREHEVTHSCAFTIGGIHATTAIESLYLARTSGGWVVSALGKSGEPRAKRPVTVGLIHRWSRLQLNVELATDERGRVELGALPGISRITATLGASTQTWSTEDYLQQVSVYTVVGRDVIVPLPPSRTATEVIRRLSIVEVTHQGQPIRHPNLTLEALESGIAIRGLPAGNFHLRGPGLLQSFISVVEARAEVANSAFTTDEVVELSRVPPAIASIDTHAGGGLIIRLRNATAATRVHVLAMTFVPSLVDTPPIGALRGPWRRIDRTRGVMYVSGRELGDEYRYILERRNAKRFPNLLLDKPSLLLNPWSRRTTSTDVATARPGGAFAPAPAYAAGMSRADGGPSGGAAGTSEGYATYDFLAEPPAVLANLAPAPDGSVTIAATELGRAASLVVLVDDPAGGATRYVPFAETPLDPRDLRLRLALDPARHATQKKAIDPLRSGERIVIDDLATAKIHLVDSVERAHGYLLALRDDATLREFAFVTRWHQIPDHERRELYSKYACHELHLFFYFKDRPFFDAVVKPYLANKRAKTFVDHYLLADDLQSWLEPVMLARLNTVERALLAQKLVTGDQIGRLIADEVTILPPDPTRDAHLIDTLLGAAALDGDDAIIAAKGEAEEEARDMAPMMQSAPGRAPAASPAMGRAQHEGAKASPPMKKMKAPAGRPREVDLELDEAPSEIAGEMLDDLQMLERAPAAPMYRAADKTQEWAENNWWHLYPTQAGPAMITANRLWRDFAAHRDGVFLSPGLGLAANSFAEAMCALAITDLPFIPGPHTIKADGPRLEITAAANALAGSSQLVDGELVTGGPPLVVGMSFVRTDDRHDWVNGEQVDKYIDGPFATGVVYTCQIVLANPTSARQRIAALIQIPRGSLPVEGARATQTIDVLLEPYGTHGHEVAFYFPSAGTWSHFPVHVSRGGAIVAAAPARTLEVTSGGAAIDPRSWPYLSQRASVPEIVAYLATANLAAIDLAKIAWRVRDRAAYEMLIGALEKRHAFDPTLWGYGLVHKDLPRIRAWLRTLSYRLTPAGPVLEMIGLDAEDLGAYEHLEYSPLINARAHRLGPKQRILNDGLAGQYTKFLDLVAHRTKATPEDLVAATSYLLAQDRVELALTTLARVNAGALADRMQYDYLAAYAACLTADVRRARELASPWREHPVDRWRHRFGALLGMLDEVDGASAPVVVDPRSRDQQHAELAAKQPTFEIAVDRDGIVIRSMHVSSLELRFFEMDVELLFSRQPFVASDVSRFSFIEPGHREALEKLPQEHRIPWPTALRGKNVVVEGVGAGQRKAKVHYANDLTTNIANQVGQVRISRSSDQHALPATYVKVYARKRGGAVAFYKDGYTDLRGWFDYATLSTTDLDNVERFAILVCSDQAGAAILETSPPTR